MDEETQGIVLRVRPYSDTSLIVHWLTRDYGRIATIVKGARRAKSPFKGKLDLCFSNEILYRRSARSDLHTLKEAVLVDSRPWLRKSYSSLQKVASAVSLLELGTEADTPLKEVFGLFQAYVDALKQADRRELLCAFEARFLIWSGILPELDTVPVSEEVRGCLFAWVHQSWEELAGDESTDPVFSSASGWLRSVMGNEYGRVPKGRNTALKG